MQSRSKFRKCTDMHVCWILERLSCMLPLNIRYLREELRQRLIFSTAIKMQRTYPKPAGFAFLICLGSLMNWACWYMLVHVGICWCNLLQNLFPFPTCSACFQGIPWTQIVPYGRSIGTAPSIHLAREYPVRGVAEHLLHCSWAQNWQNWTYCGHIVDILWTCVLTHVVLSRALPIRSLFFPDSAESYGVDLSNTASAWVHQSRPCTNVLYQHVW